MSASFWNKWRSPRGMYLLGGLLIGIAVLLIYNPALKIGFFADDYEFLVPAGRLSWPEYLATYFDPALQWHWYRPFQGMEWRLAYLLFGSNVTGYHLLQVLFHLINCLFLYGLVARIAKRWQVAWLAALIYVTLPASTLAVLWTAVADPLVAVFYLATIWLWLDYLERGGKWRYALALVAFVSALLTKETAAVLPVVLFLADRWLVGQPVALVQFVKRYAIFAVLTACYGLLELRVLTYGVFVGSIGYGVGGQIFPNLLTHLNRLAFPWGLEPPLGYAWLLVVLAGFAIAAYRRNWRLVFLGAATVLPVLPIVPFPAGIANAARYLYLPLMGSAVGVALLVDAGMTLLQKRQWRWPATVLLAAVILVSVGGGAAIAEAAQNFTGYTRETRLAFRPVFQKHETLPADTKLYFLDRWQENLEGIMFLRYGNNVSVDGTENGHVANLASHKAAYILYLDDQKIWQEQAVSKAAAQGTPSLPLRLSDSISLDAFELANDHVKPGTPLIVILYWHATSKLAKDYTVFAHLEDASGQIVAGTDSQPRRGTAPTTSWVVNNTMPDGIVIPVDTDVPLGEYKLQVGMYDLATMQRLMLLDAKDQPLTDQFTIGPVTIGQ